MRKPTILATLVVALGFVAVSSLALAQTVTTNLSGNQGLQGTSFVPSNLFGAGQDCTGVGGAGNCDALGEEALEDWLTGGYFDPRAGTEWIPPSGDHHRSGWRLMMQDHFTSGAFLTGFAPFLNVFPNYPQVGTPGPSGGNLDLLVSVFLDHHGEPISPGRYPRYIPHERQAWADTLMVKYVESSSGDFKQSIRSQVGQFRNDTDDAGSVTWMSMSNQNTEGCPGNCIWTFDVGADGISGTADDYLAYTDADGLNVIMATDGTAADVLRISSFFGANAGGTVDTYAPYTPIEAVPSFVDSRLDQSMEHGAGDGMQVLRYSFQVISGPNLNGEEGSDPYTWVICGSRTDGAGEKNCDGPFGAIIDESVHFAYLDTGGIGGKGAVFSHAERFGSDGRAFTADDGLGLDGIAGTADDTIVACDGSGVGGYVGVLRVFFGATCHSDPGGDLVYGTSDDGTIYYAEGVENGFRSGTRENRAHSFSFTSQDRFRQIMQQDIADGFLTSCLNCNQGVGDKEHPPLDPFGPLVYDQIWPQVPAIDTGEHPPNPTDSFLIVP